MIPQANNNNIPTPESEIKTPKAQEFVLSPSRLSGMLSSYARGKAAENDLLGILGKHVNKQSQQHIESDTEFISKILEIAAKSQSVEEALVKKKSINAHAQELTEEQYEQIDKMARKHAQANKFNEYSALDANEIPKQNLCTCGCEKAEGQLLPFCQNQTEKYFFGPGIILYFFIIRKILIMIIISACIYGIFSLTTNILKAPSMQNQCQDQQILKFLCQFKLLTTIKNKIEDSDKNPIFLHIQLWLGFVVCILWIIGIRIVRTMGRLLNRKIDLQLDSSSDYCIQLNNLPFGNYSEQQLLKYIAILWRKYKGKQHEQVSIKSVQIVYNLSSIRKIIEEIIQLSNNLVTMLSFNKIAKSEITASKNQTEEEMVDSIMQSEQQQGQNSKIDDQKCICVIKKQCKERYLIEKSKFLMMLQELDKTRDNFINDSNQRSQFSTQMALIEFSDSTQQTEFLKEIRQYRTTALSDFKDYLIEKCFINQESNLFKGNPIKIMRAPEPSDINWANCEKKQNFKRIILVWVITFGVIGVSFGVLMFIRFLKSKFPELNTLSVIASISLQLFNRIIWNVLCSCINLQENNTKTDNIMSIMNKSMLAQTINITVLPLIMNVVLKDNIYGPEGLIGMTVDYQLVVLLMMFNINIINFPYQIKRLALCIPFIRNWIIRKKTLLVGQFDTAEEIREVLKFYEAPEFPIAGGYIYMTAVIYQAMFFVHLQPALIFFLILNICCFYLVNKYLLLRRCKMAQLLDFIIFETSCSLLQHVTLIYAIGSLIFLSIVSKATDPVLYIPSSLCILCWLIHMINPFRIMHKITKCLIDSFFDSYEKQTAKTLDIANNTEDQSVFIKGIVRNSFMEKKMTKRRQSYYKNSGTNDIIYFESKLVENRENINFTQKFCERFQLNPPNSSLKTSKAFEIKKFAKFKEIKNENIIQVQANPIKVDNLHLPGVKVPKNILRSMKNMPNPHQHGQTNAKMLTKDHI